MNARTVGTGFVWGSVVGVAYFSQPETLPVAICALIATIFIWRSV